MRTPQGASAVAETIPAVRGQLWSVPGHSVGTLLAAAACGAQLRKVIDLLRSGQRIT